MKWKLSFELELLGIAWNIFNGSGGGDVNKDSSVL